MFISILKASLTDLEEFATRAYPYKAAVEGSDYQLFAFARHITLPLASVPAHIFVSPALRHNISYLYHLPSTRLTYGICLEPEGT